MTHRAAGTRSINLGDILEAVADAVPDRPAVVTEHATSTYAELDERTTRLANHLVSTGIEPGDHVAVHAMNRMEWAESFLGVMKARAVPININYQYLHDELVYLYDSAGCVRAIIAPEYLEAVALDLADVPQVHRSCLRRGVRHGAGRRLAERRPAAPRTTTTSSSPVAPRAAQGRDLAQEDIIKRRSTRSVGSADRVVEQLAAEAAANESPVVMLPCGPMMHGGSQWILGNAHVAGATVALYTGPTLPRREASSTW